MNRRSRRVQVRLDAGGLTDVRDEELHAILRGADDIVGRGGRNLLKLILRGSKAKRIRELGLDSSPVHGFFSQLSDEGAMQRIDWTILNGYLSFFYDGRLPLLEFTQKGWEIERENYADELLAGFDELLQQGPPFDMEYLKDRDRQMILLLLDKVEATDRPDYVPLLEAWREIDYKKVRQRISNVIRRLLPQDA